MALSASGHHHRRPDIAALHSHNNNKKLSTSTIQLNTSLLDIQRRANHSNAVHIHNKAFGWRTANIGQCISPISNRCLFIAMFMSDYIGIGRHDHHPPPLYSAPANNNQAICMVHLVEVTSANAYLYAPNRHAACGNNNVFTHLHFDSTAHY